MSLLDPSATFATLLESIGLDVRLRKAVSRIGHVRPTLVQAKCLPIAISTGRDLLVRAGTGSGKTLAYCLPLLQKLLLLHDNREKRGVNSVVLVPTRELCAQVFNTLKQLSYYCDEIIKIVVLSVGHGRGEKARQELEKQQASLRDQPNIIVATPGGLLAHIQSGDLDLTTSVETLVVDEADLVLSFGYSNDVVEIVTSLPRICQSFLLSATLTTELDSLRKVVLNSPVILKLEHDTQTKTMGQLKQFYISLPKRDKNLVIYVFLKLGLLRGKGLFFVNTTDAAYRLKLFLEQFHIRSSVLNAELPFRSRCNIIEQFNVGNFDYLIATDQSTDVSDNVMSDDEDKEDKPSKQRKNDSEYGVSRGLDFRKVSFVLNVDFPPNHRSYAHRVGRTARGGATGVALSIVELDSIEQNKALITVQNDQPVVPCPKTSSDQLHAVYKGNVGASQDQRQPVELDFDLREIEGFRYRVEDVSRAVTKIAVRETRAAELKAEILNSERLQSHFDDHPQDLQLLQHDRLSTHVSKVQEHLKHVPKYLLPRGMQVADLNKKRKRKKVRKAGSGGKRTDNDPLQSFEGGDVNFDTMLGDDESDDGSKGEDDDAPKKIPKVANSDAKVLFNTKDGTGSSTSGRNAWKEKHSKGQFSSKKRLKERRYKEPLGI